MPNSCHFCTKNIREINFRDIEILEKFISALGKIRGRKRTGVCAKHQRKLAQAIKRARCLGLLSPTRK